MCVYVCVFESQSNEIYVKMVKIDNPKKMLYTRSLHEDYQREEHITHILYVKRREEKNERIMKNQ